MPNIGHHLLRQRTFLALGFALAALAVATPSARAQEEPPPTRKVSAVWFAYQNVPELYFENVDEESQRFQIGRGGQPRPNLVPDDNRLRLYQRAEDEEGEEIRREILSLDLPSGDDPVIVAFYNGEGGRVEQRLFMDSADRHRGKTARLINLLDVRVAAIIGDEGVTVPPQSEVSNIPINTQGDAFQFKFAIQVPDGLNTNFPPKRYRLASDNRRFTVFFAYRPEVIYQNEVNPDAANANKDPNAPRAIARVAYHPNVVTMFDVVPSED